MGLPAARTAAVIPPRQSRSVPSTSKVTIRGFETGGWFVAVTRVGAHRRRPTRAGVPPRAESFPRLPGAGDRGLRAPAGEAHDPPVRYRALPVGERVTLAVLLAAFVLAVVYVLTVVM